jgi:hypothetical protein
MKNSEGRREWKKEWGNEGKKEMNEGKNERKEEWGNEGKKEMNEGKNKEWRKEWRNEGMKEWKEVIIFCNSILSWKNIFNIFYFSF